MKKRGLGLTQQTICALIVVIILYSITSIVPRLISSYLTTYFYLAIMGLCLLLLMISRGKKSIDEYVMVIIPFIAWYILTYIATKPSLTDWVYKIILDILPIVLGLYILKRCDHALIRFFSFVLIITIIVTMITTYIGIGTYPNSARYLATVANANDSLYIKYNMANIGGFEFIYTLSLLYPIAIYAYKRRKINAIIMFIISVSILTLIIESSYTTAFLMWMISSLLLFFKKELKAQFLFLIVIIAILLLVVFSESISDLFELLSTRIDNRDISERLRDLAGGREGLEQSEDPRLELWMGSISVFTNNPLIGKLSISGGGHSFILDTLATYGLLGMTLVTMLYITIFRKLYLPFKDTAGYGYIVWSFIQTIILSFLNPGMWLYVLCLYIPMLVALINKGEKPCESALGSKLDTARS